MKLGSEDGNILNRVQISICSILKFIVVVRIEAGQAGYLGLDDVKTHVIQSIMKLLSSNALVDHRQRRCPCLIMPQFTRAVQVKYKFH